jgi:hypothetical protein
MRLILFFVMYQAVSASTIENENFTNQRLYGEFCLFTLVKILSLSVSIEK